MNRASQSICDRCPQAMTKDYRSVREPGVSTGSQKNTPAEARRVRRGRPYPPLSNVPFVLGIAPAFRSSIRLAISNARPKPLNNASIR